MYLEHIAYQAETQWGMSSGLFPILGKLKV